MRVGRLLESVGRDLRLGWRHFALASVGIVLGIATLTFFLALGNGVRRVVEGDILRLDYLEVVPKRLHLDLWAVRLGVGPDLLDDEAVHRVAALPGVDAVYPKMELAVPAVLSGGASLLGQEFQVELVADGVEPARVAADVAPGFDFRDPPPGEAAPVACQQDRDCPRSAYCERSGDPAHGRCRDYVPVIASRNLVELYNGSLRRVYGLPRLNPDGLVGATAEATYGASIVRPVAEGPLIRERLRLVGFSDAAMPIGLTMPLGHVRRLNAVYRPEEAGPRYSSVIVRLASKRVAARVAEGIQGLGLEVADRAAERVAFVIAAITAVLALLSGAIVAVAVVHVMHAFFTLVLARQREIGLMRAVGGSRNDLRLMVLVEAAAMGLVAAAAGVALAGAAAWLCDRAAGHLVPDFPYRPESFFAWEPWLLALALALGVVACVLGAAAPAARAVKRDAAELLSGR